MHKATEPTASALVGQMIDVVWGATDVIEPLIDGMDRLAPEKLSRLNEALQTLQRLKQRMERPHCSPGYSWAAGGEVAGAGAGIEPILDSPLEAGGVEDMSYEGDSNASRHQRNVKSMD